MRSFGFHNDALGIRVIGQHGGESQEDRYHGGPKAYAFLLFVAGFFDLLARNLFTNQVRVHIGEPPMRWRSNDLGPRRHSMFRDSIFSKIFRRFRRLQE
jgi:hypothetical protein